MSEDNTYENIRILEPTVQKLHGIAQCSECGATPVPEEYQIYTTRGWFCCGVCMERYAKNMGGVIKTVSLEHTLEHTHTTR